MAVPFDLEAEIRFQAWHETRDDAGRPRGRVISGRYIDENACHYGEWRIIKHTFITAWVKNDPADRAFFVANPTTNRSGRGE